MARAAKTVRLGRRTVAALPLPTSGPAFHWDADLPGFGLVLRPSGARSWIVQYRTGAGDRRAPTRRLVLGDANVLTPEEARAAAKSVLATVALGGDPAGDKAADREAPTVAEVAARYLSEHVEPKRKARTTESYRQGFDNHILPRIGKLKANVVSRRDIMKLHHEVGRKVPVPVRGSKTAERQVGGPVTANRALASLSAMFSWAAGAGLVPEGFNPTARVERFREEPGERFLSDEETARLGAALVLVETGGIPWRAQDLQKPGAKHMVKAANRREVFGPHAVGAIRLLILTGMRLREVLNLEWTHYDRQRGLLLLPDSKSGRKAVTLSSAAVAVLAGIPKLGRYVIASDSAGTPEERPRHDLHRPWRSIRRHAGLEDVRLHDLRHSFAATGAGGGASLPQIGKLLGHTQASTTARYAHLAASAERRVADQIGSHLAAALGLPAAEVVSLNERRRA